MNYIFAHFGKEPSHLSYFFNTILSVDTEAKIFFINNFDYKSEKIKSFNLNQFKELEFKSSQISKLVDLSDVDDNPLWGFSLLRIYALQTLVKFLQIDKFVHFDTDVLIYESFEDIKNRNLFSEDKINITFHDKNSLVFGYSYFPNIHVLDRLIENIDEILTNYKFYQNRFTKNGDGFVSEMKMLSICKSKNPMLFNYLNSLPYWGDSAVFDPAGYGQYLDGSHLKRGNYIFKRRWVGLNTELGKELKSKRIKVRFKNNQPEVLYNKKIVKIVSLHVHSKRLNKFLPKEYQDSI